jgi:hypothetical protein
MLWSRSRIIMMESEPSRDVAITPRLMFPTWLDLYKCHCTAHEKSGMDCSGFKEYLDMNKTIFSMVLTQYTPKCKLSENQCFPKHVPVCHPYPNIPLLVGSEFFKQNNNQNVLVTLSLNLKVF